jgi:hypothetical protein
LRGSARALGRGGVKRGGEAYARGNIRPPSQAGPRAFGV